MKPEIETIQQFIRSLSPNQRNFFVTREADVQARLQASLRDLGRAMGEVSGLNGEALAVVTSVAGISPRPRQPKAR